MQIIAFRRSLIAASVVAVAALGCVFSPATTAFAGSPTAALTAAANLRSAIKVAAAAHVVSPAPVAAAPLVLQPMATPAAPGLAVSSRPTAPRQDRLTGANGTLDLAVGNYSDCSAQTAVPRSVASIDTCIPNRLYFLGHNPGVFTPLMGATVGTRLTWWDHNGAAHNFVISRVRTVNASDGISVTSPRGVIAQFQMCVTPSGSVVRVLDAIQG